MSNDDVLAALEGHPRVGQTVEVVDADVTAYGRSLLGLRGVVHHSNFVGVYVKFSLGETYLLNFRVRVVEDE